MIANIICNRELPRAAGIGEDMPGILSTVLLTIALCCPLAAVAAQQTTNGASNDVAPLLQQNPLIADVARNNPDGLWGLISQLEILTTARRDSGASRSGTSPLTRAESEQIDANPALRLSYQNDRAATVALLRATNDALRRAHLQEAGDSRRRVALVIGSSGDRIWGKLGTAANDANLLADALARQGFDVFAGHALIDPDRAQFLRAVKDFSRLIGPDTVALLYYAGHGVQLNGRNFLVPSGAAVPRTDDDYDRNLIAVDDTVLSQMQQGKPRLRIIVLDACRDAPTLVSGRARTNPGLAPTSPEPHTKNTVIIYSTEPNDVARDGSAGSLDSPFATAFASAIAEPGLELRDVFDRVQLAVDRATDQRQQPWISYSSIGKFYFSSGFRPGAVSQSAYPDTQPFHCPVPGSAITLANMGGPLTLTYDAADPNDPTLCRARTSTGDMRTLLYNFFDTAKFADLTQVRGAMNDLLSKQKEEAAFEVTLRMTSLVTYRENWKRIGVETIRVGDQLQGTIRFERRTKDLRSGNPGEVWNVWYSPAAGAFVRGERTPIASLGGGTPGNFQVTSFTP